MAEVIAMGTSCRCIILDVDTFALHSAKPLVKRCYSQKREEVLYPVHRNSNLLCAIPNQLDHQGSANYCRCKHMRIHQTWPVENFRSVIVSGAEPVFFNSIGFTYPFGVDTTEPKSTIAGASITGNALTMSCTGLSCKPAFGAFDLIFKSALYVPP